MSRRRRVSGILRRLATPGFGLGVALLMLAAADVLLPARSGVLGLSRVLAPYLALLFLPLGLLALLARGPDRRRLAVVAVVGIAVAAVRFLPTLPSGPVAADPAVPQVRLATWNLYLGTVPAETLVGALAARAPGIVGLQELTHAAAAVISADPDLRDRFPYRVLHPADDWTGMGLLSSWPIDPDPGSAEMPPLIEATVRPSDAPPIHVIVVHPPPPLVRVGPFGPTYDQGRRDASVLALRQRVDAGLDAGRRLAVLGDLNLTDREVAYADLMHGLTDAHRAVGSGLGDTWRPPLGDGLPFGMLRIDMVLTGPGVTPLMSSPDCTPRVSDHCILDVTVALPAD